ncbi:Uncharacterized protein TCM_037352 [Theobroma cacao]|uniref:Transmembrane protein n=1 Tax=Theobroma cacao TaxID=3641 RepID=A0A061GKD2_THECC|nr:Uncharacterized protein TCM_037352 [Theobroma cacao]
MGSRQLSFSWLISDSIKSRVVSVVFTTRATGFRNSRIRMACNETKFQPLQSCLFSFGVAVTIYRLLLFLYFFLFGRLQAGSHAFHVPFMVDKASQPRTVYFSLIRLPLLLIPTSK